MQPGSLKKCRHERRLYVHKLVATKSRRDHVASDFFELIGRGLAGAAVLLDLVAHLLAFLQITQAGALDGADMNENVRSAIIRLDEAKALLTVEPFHSSVSHVTLQAKLEEGPIRETGSIDVWKSSSAASFPKQVQVVRPKIDARGILTPETDCKAKTRKRIMDRDMPAYPDSGHNQLAALALVPHPSAIWNRTRLLPVIEHRPSKTGFFCYKKIVFIRF
jgi:hypothetical protein